MPSLFFQGEYYTPKSIVTLIVEMLEPYNGRVYDPAMGSGGFFVSTDRFIEEHSKEKHYKASEQKKQISVYGQEANPTTWKLAAMNMVIRGIDFNFGKKNADTFLDDQHPDLRADYVMANPPFNIKDWWHPKLEGDSRWKYGTPPQGNANFGWMQHMLYHLAPTGSMALLLANGSMSSNTNNEGDIRKNLIEKDLVECMVALPGQLFTNTQIPACIWFLTVTNAGGAGAQTTSDGILVVDAQNGGTTQANAFQLVNRARAGAYDYFLFRGGLDGVSNPDDWFLRSTFISNPGGVPITTLPAPPPVFPVVPPIAVLPPGGGGGGVTPLPPGTFPITGPELPAYGVAQPMALTAGLTVLGTMHERIGDTLTRSNLGDETEAQGWGRLFAQNMDRRYAAFANPTAKGNLIGFQAGQDVFRREGVAGDRDAAGFYLAYTHSNIDVDGLVTNADATGYIRTDAGDMDLNGYSLAGYWTHYGADEWYVNAVIQGTYYRGDSETQDAKLPLRGGGFLGSLEAGYPVKLPLGGNFALEPQAQAIWQQIDFKEQNDGYGRVDPGRTRMTTGRLGLRGQWTLPAEDGVIWQPYVRMNYWRDWGDNAVTKFDDDRVPLVIDGQRMEYAGGLSIKMDNSLSFYAQAGIQHGIGEKSYEEQRMLTGNLGLRYTW